MGLLQGGSMDRRFFHRLGASLLDRTICSTAGMYGMRYTVGGSVGTNPETVDQAKYILIWGSNVITSNIHLWRYMLKARSQGAKIVTIDPLRTRTAEQSDEHIPIMPGTDGALALGMMHIIFRDGLHDKDYIDRHTLGVEALRTRVLEYTPARVSEITGIPEAAIERLTQEYAARSPAIHPAELRSPTPRRRRHGCAKHLLSARTCWRLAPSRWRRIVEFKRLLQIQHSGARAARPDRGKAANGQHEPARRSFVEG